VQGSERLESDRCTERRPGVHGGLELCEHWSSLLPCGWHGYVWAMGIGQAQFCFTVLRILNIFVWIRIRIWIRGSLPLTNGSGSGSRCGSGSCYFHHYPSRCQKCFAAYYFLKVHLHHFSKIKVKNKSESIRNQEVSGSGSRRPKNKIWIQRIRIRIHNTAF
jgi:hypothetical protein